jgi:hypothetical protein
MTCRIQIKLQLKGKSRLIFKLMGTPSAIYISAVTPVPAAIRQSTKNGPFLFFAITNDLSIEITNY